MANIDFHGLDELRLSIQQVAELPDEVVDEMLNAAADITVEAQRAEAEKLGMYAGRTTHNNTRDTSATNFLRGQAKSYSTGATARSIKKGKVKTNAYGTRVLYITPTGSRTRGKKNPKKIRNAEIAFLNEYGTRTINARGFIRKANELSAAEATAAQAAVYDRFLKSKNL